MTTTTIDLMSVCVCVCVGIISYKCCFQLVFATKCTPSIKSKSVIQSVFRLNNLTLTNLCPPFFIYNSSVFNFD